MNADDDRPLAPDDPLRALARALTFTDGHLDEPPAEVWAGIEARLASTAGPVRAAAPGARVQPGPARWWRSPQILGAAAALLVFGLVLGLVATLAGGDGAEVVERARLESAATDPALDPVGEASSGQASLVRLADGRYALDVTMTGLPETPDAFLELWLLDERAEGMVSLGPVGGPATRVVLPAGVDPSGFPVVDVSVEPADGVPVHSGRSILRGRLVV